jgi:hypothetical protein
VLFCPQTGYTRYREFRIFRNDPRIRFRSMIHETILPALEEVSERDGLRIAPCDVAIDHIGYDGDQSHKHARNLPLLQARLAADPDHVYCWTHLGRTLQALGRGEEARAAWRRGIAVVRGHPRSQTSTACLRTCCATLPSRIRIPTLLEETPLFHDPAALVSGLRAPALRRPSSAGVWRIDPGFLTFIAYDMRIFGVQTHDSLASTFRATTPPARYARLQYAQTQLSPQAGSWRAGSRRRADGLEQAFRRTDGLEVNEVADGIYQPARGGSLPNHVSVVI